MYIKSKGTLNMISGSEVEQIRRNSHSALFKCKSANQSKSFAFDSAPVNAFGLPPQKCPAPWQTAWQVLQEHEPQLGLLGHLQDCPKAPTHSLSLQ